MILIQSKTTCGEVDVQKWIGKTRIKRLNSEPTFIQHNVVLPNLEGPGKTLSTARYIYTV